MTYQLNPSFDFLLSRCQEKMTNQVSNLSVYLSQRDINNGAFIRNLHECFPMPFSSENSQ